MSNKLFIVCPFSGMENLIRQNYGDDVFFMSAMAAVLSFNAEEISDMKYFIVRENIDEIIVASDISCRFINAALKHEKQFGSDAEKVIENIVLENIDVLAKANSNEEKQKIILNSLIKNQAQKIYSPSFFLSEIFANKISVKGIITKKSNNEIIELNFKNY